MRCADWHYADRLDLDLGSRCSVVQAASVAVYILSGLFGLGFIATFVICIISIMLDFWTVRD
jgi:hypothetical protein